MEAAGNGRFILLGKHLFPGTHIIAALLSDHKFEQNLGNTSEILTITKIVK